MTRYRSHRILTRDAAGKWDDQPEHQLSLHLPDDVHLPRLTGADELKIAVDGLTSVLRRHSRLSLIEDTNSNNLGNICAPNNSHSQSSRNGVVG